MANLYKVRDSAMDVFFVLAVDEAAALSEFQTWVEDPDNDMSPEDRMPVHSVSCIASQEAVDPSNRINLILGPVS